MCVGGGGDIGLLERGLHGVVFCVFVFLGIMFCVRRMVRFTAFFFFSFFFFNALSFFFFFHSIAFFGSVIFRFTPIRQHR